MALRFFIKHSYNGSMYSGRSPLFTLNQDCQAVTSRVVAEAHAAGIEAKRTFDLQAVRSANPGFCCPLHGAAKCTCQVVILLVLLRPGCTLTLLLEGRDQETWVYLEPEPGKADEQVDPSLVAALYRAFFPKRAAEAELL